MAINNTKKNALEENGRLIIALQKAQVQLDEDIKYIKSLQKENTYLKSITARVIPFLNTSFKIKLDASQEANIASKNFVSAAKGLIAEFRKEAKEEYIKDAKNDPNKRRNIRKKLEKK